MGQYHEKKILISSGANAAFILVEVIVAVSILALAVPAALTVASKGIVLGTTAKNNVIATYLAQEGLEIIRNRRDQNMIKAALTTDPDDWKNWTEGFYAKPPGEICNGNNVPCIVDYGVNSSGVLNDPKIEPCQATCSQILSKNTADGTYAHVPVGTWVSGTWVSTIFSRYVTTESVPGSGGNPDEIKVTSVVTYNDRGVTKTVSATTNLTAWIR